MSRVYIAFFTLFIAAFSCKPEKEALNESSDLYVFNREPLIQNTYAQLPIGSIKPEGWLHEQLLIMKK